MGQQYPYNCRRSKVNNALVATGDVAKKKQTRFELRVDQEWLDRIERQASRFGLTTAAYIRQACQLKLEADEGTERGTPPPAGEGEGG